MFVLSVIIEGVLISFIGERKMKDNEIIDLFFKREEKAILETKNKYGRYCFYIAFNILNSNLDAEECVDDTYLKLWNSIPPNRPKRFQSFIGRIVRNLSINRYKYNNAQKRSSNYEVIVEELQECVQDNELTIVEGYVLKEILNQFLASLSKRQRIIFLQRYWYFCSISEIASYVGLKENNVKVILHRLREQFKEFFIQKGGLM